MPTLIFGLIAVYAVAFVIYYLATSPQGAANVVTGALDWLKSAGNSLSAFLNHIKL